MGAPSCDISRDRGFDTANLRITAAISLESMCDFEGILGFGCSQPPIFAECGVDGITLPLQMSF